MDKTAENSRGTLGLVTPMNHAKIGGYLNTVRTQEPKCAEHCSGGCQGQPTGGHRFGDVKADLHYTESKDTVCLLYYPEINEFQGRRTVQAVIESWR